MIFVHLRERALLTGKADPVVQGAPTGITAINIRGRAAGEKGL
jgi:hypothetical protein